MRKVFDIFVEFIFWIAIFASPFLLSIAIGLFVYIHNKNLLWVLFLISSIGFITGVFIAEKIRRKYGCTIYMSKIFS